MTNGLITLWANREKWWWTTFPNSPGEREKERAFRRRLISSGEQAVAAVPAVLLRCLNLKLIEAVVVSGRDCGGCWGDLLFLFFCFALLCTFFLYF